MTHTAATQNFQDAIVRTAAAAAPCTCGAVKDDHSMTPKNGEMVYGRSYSTGCKRYTAKV